jgi:hypothetical protein
MSLGNKNNHHQDGDDEIGGNMAGIDGLGEVGRPDWMESDSSDDGQLMNNRNNFDLGRPPSCKHILQSFVST